MTTSYKKMRRGMQNFMCLAAELGYDVKRKNGMFACGETRKAYILWKASRSYYARFDREFYVDTGKQLS